MARAMKEDETHVRVKVREMLEDVRGFFQPKQESVECYDEETKNWSWHIHV